MRSGSFAKTFFKLCRVEGHLDSPGLLALKRLRINLINLQIHQFDFKRILQKGCSDRYEIFCKEEGV